MRDNPLFIWISAGVAAGILSGLFGVGGGIIIIPFLALGLNYPQQTANGTSLVALLYPVGMLAVISYYRAGKIGMPEIKAGSVIALVMLFTAPLGAQIALRTPEQWLRKGFAVILVYVAVKLWLKK